ncbi:hypothetical protein LINPERPRIM_LOCUS15361, partial [Linum perenne]
MFLATFYYLFVFSIFFKKSAMVDVSMELYSTELFFPSSSTVLLQKSDDKSSNSWSTDRCVDTCYCVVNYMNQLSFL